MKRKKGIDGGMRMRVIRNRFGNMVDLDVLTAERVNDPMVLMSMGKKISKKQRRDDKEEKEDRKMNWDTIPTTEDLQTRGVYDRVEAIACDMDKWSLFGLSKWRKPMNEDHVKRQQRKLKRLFLRNSCGKSVGSSSTESTPSHYRSARSPRKNTPTRKPHDDGMMDQD